MDVGHGTPNSTNHGTLTYLWNPEHVFFDLLRKHRIFEEFSENIVLIIRIRYLDFGTLT